MFTFRRPDDDELDTFLRRLALSDRSYEPIGLSSMSPDGYNIDELRVEIGRGQEQFEKAKRALDSWRGLDVGWAFAKASEPTPEVGADVVVAAGHLGFWSLNGCRVVARAAETENRAGFSYGTLADHAEEGEESFTVELDQDIVWYSIRAVSKPHALLARLGGPVARRLQHKFRVDSAAAMRRAVNEA